MVSRFSVRLQLLKSLKLYILHGQLLESDAPLAGGLWNALQGLVLLWKALSVSGLLFWPGPGPGAWALGCPARQNPMTLSAVRPKFLDWSQTFILNTLFVFVIMQFIVFH